MVPAQKRGPGYILGPLFLLHTFISFTYLCRAYSSKVEFNSITFPVKYGAAWLPFPAHAAEDG
jgi:hypothetical protein